METPKKTVRFCNVSTTHEMLSSSDYDRKSIKVDNSDNYIWRRIFQDLYNYKKNEMSVHTDFVK